MLQIVDYYRILQVDPEALPDVVRAAYRVLARLYHPDVEGGDWKKMAALNHAWNVIQDPKMRAAYDRSRAALAPLTPRAPAAPARNGAGPLPGQGGTVLDFSRYSGWTIDQIARQDPDFLEWLLRMPIGRPYKTEIETVLAARQKRGLTKRA